MGSLVAKKNTKADFEHNASIEFEVARARLAKAHRHAEYGEVELAINDAIESCFDAGMTHTYGQLAKNDAYVNGAKDLEGQAQTLLSALTGRNLKPRLAKNPRSYSQVTHKKAAESSLARAVETHAPDEVLTSTMNTAFHAGAAYAYSKKEDDKQYNLQLFNEAVQRAFSLVPKGRAANPPSTRASSHRAVKAKLLRY